MLNEKSIRPAELVASSFIILHSSFSISPGGFMFTFRTIRDGERVAIWDRSGRVEFVSGPRRLLLHRRTVEPLARYAAGADQYLVIRFKDGHSQHLHGPAAVWFHPVEHQEIRVEPAVSLDGNEAVVVYSQEGGATGQPDRVARRVVRGPALFMPAANEWLHEFSWHGASPANAARKVPRALRFTKLRVIPDQMYHDVEDVRTADDALLVVRLMIFFELTDIEQMLDRTHDPVADFINAASADVMDFTAAMTFERFKERTEGLSDLATYKQLCGRAERMGYRVSKVAYRGYQASNKLQAMHDGAIEARTRLRLEAETEAQAQDLADLKVRRELERAAQRRAMEEEDLHHANKLKRLSHEEMLRQAQAARAAKLEARRSAGELEQQHLAARNQERLGFLRAMETMHVDLTRYLIARYQHPDRIIRIESGRNGVSPRFHLHEGATALTAAGADGN
jgi:hypothetical protein